MASPTQWTWVWVNSGSWRWTRKPGVLQSMGSPSQTRLNWTVYFFYLVTFGCTGSFLLLVGFLEWWWVGATPCFGGQAVGVWVSLVVAHRPNCSEAWGIFPYQGSVHVSCIGRCILYLLCLRGSPLILDYCLLFNLGGEKSKQSWFFNKVTMLSVGECKFKHIFVEGFW